MNVTREQVESGQAVYTTRVLKLYDFVVLGVSNRFIWKCPTPQQLQHYEQHLSVNHLDVGVGSGYFLDHCRFPSTPPRVALLDLNPTASTSRHGESPATGPSVIAATFSNPSRSMHPASTPWRSTIYCIVCQVHWPRRHRYSTTCGH